MDLWAGSERFIVSALNGDISRTMASVPPYQDDPDMNRFFLRVSLFVAAHMDYVNLAAQAQLHGVRWAPYR